MHRSENREIQGKDSGRAGKRTSRRECRFIRHIRGLFLDALINRPESEAKNSAWKRLFVGKGFIAKIVRETLEEHICDLIYSGKEHLVLR